MSDADRHRDRWCRTSTAAGGWRHRSPSATPRSPIVRFGADGLVPAIVQDAADGTVLMIGYMDEMALRRTLSSGRSWFWSRSRQEYWCKGETSGDRQWVRGVRYDCDGDALLADGGPGRRRRLPHRRPQLFLPGLR